MRNLIHISIDYIIFDYTNPSLYFLRAVVEIHLCEIKGISLDWIDFLSSFVKNFKKKLFCPGGEKLLENLHVPVLLTGTIVPSCDSPIRKTISSIYPL